MNRQLQKWRDEYKIGAIHNDLAFHYLIARSVILYQEHHALFYAEHLNGVFATFEEMMPVYRRIADVNPLDEWELYSVMSAYCETLEGFVESKRNHLGLILAGYIQWLRNLHPKPPEVDAVVQWWYRGKNKIAPQNLIEAYRSLGRYPVVQSDFGIEEKIAIENQVRVFTEILLEAGMNELETMMRNFDMSLFEELMLKTSKRISIG